tara:strand:+ start:9225 stop:10145 length:921 start_codon:yes stop_codon:yes gene_type:complete
MAYPPTPPTNTRLNTTPQVDAHPLDHNTLSNNVTDIVNELGPNPKGNATDVGARFDLLVPTGCMMDYAGSAAPSGWILCDGTARSKTDSLYAALFGVIGYTFGGAGDSFNAPDLRDKSTVGISGSKVRGSTGGSTDVKEHLHQVPLHNHSVPLHNHTLNAHTHGLAGHTHVTDIDHDHGSFSTGTNGSHNHTGLSQTNVGTYGVFGLGNSGTLYQSIAVGSGITNLLVGSGGSDHAHTGTISALGIDDITTKSQGGGEITNSLSTPNTGDKPAFNVTDKPATDTVNAGAGTDNYHPYLAVYKIIKL